MAFACEHRANPKRSMMPHVYMLFVCVETVSWEVFGHLFPSNVASNKAQLEPNNI